MVASNRDVSIKETLKWEGGYSNHPNDAGGPTNWGITIADARKYWKRDASAEDVKAMPKSVAVDIYTQKYWKTSYYDCDKLDGGVDLATFDFGVNSGPSRAKTYLDKVVGGTAVETVNKLCDERLAFMKRAKNSKTGQPLWPSFGKGWTNRMNGIRAKSLDLAKGIKPSTGTPEAAGPIIIGGALAAGAPIDYSPYIFGAAIVMGIVTYFAIRWYKRSKGN